MKIERISDRTVKLTLNNIDFEKRSINAQKLRVDSLTYQKLLWDALEHAEIELGVHIATGHISVEAVSPESGCYEITITNIPGEEGGKARPEALGSGASNEIRNLQPARQAVAIPAQMLAQLVRSGIVPAELVRGILPHGVMGHPGMGEDSIEDAPEGQEEHGLISALRLAAAGNGRIAFPDRNGNGVICFGDYNELYDFFQANRSFAVLISSLYMLEDSFYLLVHDSGRHAAMMSYLEVRLTDYNAILLPADIFVPLLKEYGTPVFKKAAIRKIIASMGK